MFLHPFPLESPLLKFKVDPHGYWDFFTWLNARPTETVYKVLIIGVKWGGAWAKMGTGEWEGQAPGYGMNMS